MPRTRGAEHRPRLPAWCATAAVAGIASVGVVLLMVARADNNEPDREVLMTIVRGLQERDRSLSELEWCGTDTRQFDSEIQRGLGQNASGFTRRIMWARRGPRICAASETTQEIALDGTKTTPKRPEGVRDDMFAAWDEISVFDGEATLAVWVPTSEGATGTANVLSGPVATPIMEFGPVLGVLRTADELAAAVEAGKAKAERVRLNDVDCWRVEFWRDDKGNRPAVRRLWVAPEFGFAAVREERFYTEGWLYRETERTNFAQFNKDGQSVWIPKTVTRKGYHVDKRWREQPWFAAVLSVKQVALQVAPDHPFLDLSVDDLPPGYAVVDTRSGTNYYSGVPPEEYDDQIRSLAERLSQFMRDRDAQKLQREGTQQDAGGRHTGPQALMLLCAMEGIETGTPELIELSGTVPQGTTMNGLAAAAGQKGLKSSSQSVATEEFAQLKTPFIVQQARNRFLLVVSTMDESVIVVSPPLRIDAVPLYNLSQLLGPKVTALTVAAN